MSDSETPPPNRPPRQPFQFSLGTLMFAALVVSLMAAALSGMLNRRAGTSPMPAGFFVAMAIFAPLAVMLLANLLLAIRRWFDRRR